MNNFEAKYIQIASKYLSEKLEQLHIQDKKPKKEEAHTESTIQKIVSSLFK